ncbi:MAG: DoxX family membrane protein [Candidatus Nanohaloarchaea archaeon]|nr:DoxX family membrane protein [Candidatus Nanohaloarchaea archaeon]
MVFDTALSQYAFLLGRVLFGGLLSFMSLHHFLELDELAGYAEAKNIPVPRMAVAGSGLVLLAGGLSVLLGAYPMVGSTLIVVFFVPVTVTMHDFWNVDDPERRQQEMNQFLKNTALTGGALILYAVATVDWPYALGLAL